MKVMGNALGFHAIPRALERQILGSRFIDVRLHCAWSMLYRGFVIKNLAYECHIVFALEKGLNDALRRMEFWTRDTVSDGKRSVLQSCRLVVSATELLLTSRYHASMRVGNVVPLDESSDMLHTARDTTVIMSEENPRKVASPPPPVCLSPLPLQSC